MKHTPSETLLKILEVLEVTGTLFVKHELSENFREFQGGLFSFLPFLKDTLHTKKRH